MPYLHDPPRDFHAVLARKRNDDIRDQAGQPLRVGKWYVTEDTLGRTWAGPFDTPAEADEQAVCFENAMNELSDDFMQDDPVDDFV